MTNSKAEILTTSNKFILKRFKKNQNVKREISDFYKTQKLEFGPNSTQSLTKLKT